jgi:DNA-binding SARP family transcriptional activator/uncharacterized membrane protein YheB (UPF0754 family)
MSESSSPNGVREQLEQLKTQLSALAASVANQQSVFVDIAGARTADLRASLSEIRTVTTELRDETQRLRQLEDAIAHHMHDLVLDVVQPELRAALGEQLPQLIVAALGPEVRRGLEDSLPRVVAEAVTPDVRELLSEWLPVMVADTVPPEVRSAIAERLPEMTADAVQPEVRRVLIERLPDLVAETVQPELRQVLAQRLPYLVAETVQPELRQTLADRLPDLVSETVRPELRQTLEQRLPTIVAEVVGPEIRRTLVERLPVLVAENVQPEVRQAFTERLPAIVAEAVSPTVAAMLLERIPAMLGEAISPELSVTLAEIEGSAAELRHEAAKIRGVREVVSERLPESVVSIVEPQLHEMMAVRFPRLVSDAVEPAVRQILAEQLPQLVAAAVQPDVSAQLAAQIPTLVSETVRPELRQTVSRELEEQLPGVVAEAVQTELRQRLEQSLADVVAEGLTPHVISTVTARLPAMLGEALSPELSVSLAEIEGTAAEMRAETARMRNLREVVAERLPPAVMAAVQAVLEDTMTIQLPELLGRLVPPALADAVARPLPTTLGELLEPALRAVLAQDLPEVVGATLEREVQRGLGEGLPAAIAASTDPVVHSALTQVTESAARLDELREDMLRRMPAVVEEIATAPLEEFRVLASELHGEAERLRELQGEIRNELRQQLPELTDQAVAAPLAELSTSSADLRAEAERLRDLRAEIRDRLPGLAETAMADTLAQLEASTNQLRGEAEQLRNLRSEIKVVLPVLAEHAVAGPLAEFEASAARLRSEAERLHGIREDLVGQLPGMLEGAVTVPLAGLDASAAQLRGEAERLRSLREELVARLPSLVESAVAAPLGEFEASTAQLRGEAEQLRTLREELLARLPTVVEEAVTASLNEFEASTVQLRNEADSLRGVRHELAEQLPGVVREVVASVLEARPAPPLTAVEPPEPTVASPGRPRSDAPFDVHASPPPAAPPTTTPRTAPAAAEPLLFEPAPATPTAPGGDEPWQGDWTPEPDVGHPTGVAAPPEAAPAPVEPAPGEEPVAPIPPPPAPVEEPVASGAALAEEEASAIACVLPGLVVGPSLARGISEAVTRARLRRRRRRRAGPPAAGLYRRDPFAGELTRRLEWFALGRRQDGNGAGSHRSGDPDVIPVGERDGNEVTLALTGNGGLCVLGPRAREAARAMLVTFLAEHRPEDGRAIVIGDLLPQTTAFPGLGRAPDIGSVLGGLQAEISRRRSLFNEAGADDLAAYRARRPEEPLPLVLVAASEMTTLEAGRLVSLLEDGVRYGILGLAVDAPIQGLTTIRLQGSGRVASVSPERAESLVGARLFTIDRDPSAELLEVLASARSDVDTDPQPPLADEPFAPITSSTALINVHLLGTYRIEANNREIRSGLRAKARELLAFYLLHPEGTSLEEATEALWPEADPRRGSEWFWTALGNLRSRLRSATENKNLKVIEREGDRYRIEPVFDVDVWRFQSALAVAGASSSEPSWGDSLQEAADLYTGELLAGTAWPWAEVPREDLRGRAVDVLVSLAATRLVAGDVRAALDALERAVEVDPLAEQLYRRIMRLQAKLARPDQVDATFRTLQARLGEFDLEPSPESEKLHAELVGAG